MLSRIFGAIGMAIQRHVEGRRVLEGYTRSRI
jgi:hypothetical protein